MPKMLDILKIISTRIGELTTQEREMIYDLHAELSRRRNSTIRYALIAALPKELAAIKAAVVSCQPEYNELGNVLYYRGNIPGLYGDNKPHQVVIAITIRMGNNASAVASTSLIKDFSNLRDIVMVGIAGGIPGEQGAEDDVRLGDIVVSNALIQYDFLKIEDNKETWRGELKPPSRELLQIANDLEAGRRLGLHPWEPHIHDISNKTENGSRPSKETDPRDRYRTAPDTDPRRRSDHPKIHLGVIGSANILLKSEKSRDQLKKRHKILAVEMEGSGISDASWSFKTGYLLVRGICDYCDKSKNDAWQEYAAAAAAGYMRALIEKVPVQRLSVFDKLDESIERDPQVTVGKIQPGGPPPALPAS
jgi:nucleoside phosphorylase